MEQLEGGESTLSFTADEVRTAIKACNFNKGMGPDGFHGSILKPDQPNDPLTNNIVGQLIQMLERPASIPNYLKEGRLVPLSKNKGKDLAGLKDIRPIIVRSHLAKILEKATLAKLELLAPHLLGTKQY